MDKKFIPLSAKKTYIKDPYKIKTYRNPSYSSINNAEVLQVQPGCVTHRELLAATSAEKPKTIQDQILERYHKCSDESNYIYDHRSIKRKCRSCDQFKECVKRTRSAKQLQRNAETREGVITICKNISCSTHIATEYYSKGKLVRFDSPTTVGEVKLRPASPSCSMEAVFIPSKRLLDLKKPRSSIFINEQVVDKDTSIPYSTYNPRILQEKLDSKKWRNYDLCETDDNKFFVKATDSDDVFDRKTCCCYLFKPPKVDPKKLEEECIHFKPEMFVIPSNLSVTFRAKKIFADASIDRKENDMINRRPVSLAAIYVAFATVFNMKPTKWCSTTMNGILIDAQTLHRKSTEVDFVVPDGDFDIIPEIEEYITTVNLKHLYTHNINKDPNILKVLTKFLAKHSHIFFRYNDLFLLIFKTCESIFWIFDPNGRNENLDRVAETYGQSVLLTTNTIEHVVHIILNKNDILPGPGYVPDENESQVSLPTPRDEYMLYELTLVNFGLIPSPLNIGEVKQNKKYFNVVNKFYAVIPGKIGIEPPNDPEEINTSIMTCYVALLYAHIDPPRHWPRPIIDNIIKYGGKYYLRYIRDNHLEEMNVKDLPSILVLGTYRGLIHKHPFYKSGHLQNCRIYSNSTLTQALRDFFKSEKLGLLTIDNSTVAIFRDHNFYYVFDPFQRGVAGEVINIKENDNGAGCLQMHLNQESMLRMVYKNATDMVTEGNFFIHAIDIESVNVLSANKYLKASGQYAALKIIYPFKCDQTSRQFSCSDLRAAAKLVPTTVPPECLSLISVSPCQRTCSEAEFIEGVKKDRIEQKKLEHIKHAYSLHSISEINKIPEYHTAEIAEYMVGKIVCSVLKIIQEEQERPFRTFMKAKKVLLKTDEGYLQDMKLKLKRGQDYDNLNESFKSHPGELVQMPLKEELEIESNFMVLPDGSWAIFGLNEVTASERSDLRNAALTALFSTVVSEKYKICSWNPSTIDYVIESSVALQTEFEPLTKIITLFLKRNMPKIKVGAHIFHPSVQKLRKGAASELKDILPLCLTDSNKLLVIFNTFCCAVFKRYNFFYLFCGLPCDIVGFRSFKTGRPCLLRFIDFSTLIRRIHFGRYQMDEQQQFVIMNVHIGDITSKEIDRYVPRTESEEHMFYENELHEKEKNEKKLAQKLAFINQEIYKEKRRIKSFKVEKCKRYKRKLLAGDLDDDEQEEEECLDEMDEDEYEESEDEDEVEFKQNPDREFVPDDPLYMKSERKRIKYAQTGYRLVKDDCQFKIQGTTAMANRFEGTPKTIRSCFIAGVYAILSAILRPLCKWDYRRIDMIIESANDLFQTIKDRRTSCQRQIKHIQIDEFIFNVNIKVFEILWNKSATVETLIKRITRNKKYFLIQISNATFAVFKDEYYHLFDPYPSLEKSSNESEEAEASNTIECPKNMKRFLDKNTASWVLFPNLEAMFEYISERAMNPDWKYEVKLHIVQIMTFKKAPRKSKMARFLVDVVNEQDDSDLEKIDLIEPEKIKWLEMCPSLIPWSRHTKANLVKQGRGLPHTRHNAFDIEIPDELYSLWGSIHPTAPVFNDMTRGKQYLAINVIACCMASVYRITEWNRNVLDSIVINGDRYFDESISDITKKEYEISLEDLNTDFIMDHMIFDIHIIRVGWGILYNIKANELNVSRGLTFFFKQYRYGIIQCLNRSLAFGRANKGYFMFDCQSVGYPLFPRDEGAAYLLRCRTLQRLVHCIILTLNVPYFNIDFTIHKVEMNILIKENEAEGE